MGFGMILLIGAVGAVVIAAVVRSNQRSKDRFVRCASCGRVLNSGDGRVPATCPFCGHVQPARRA